MAKGEKVAAGDPRDLNKNGRVSKKEQRKFNRTADAGNAGPLAGYNLTLLEDHGDAMEIMEKYLEIYKTAPESFNQLAFNAEMDESSLGQAYSVAAIKDLTRAEKFPELYAQEIEAERETLRDEVRKMGGTLTDSELDQLVKDGRRLGLSPSQMTNKVAMEHLDYNAETGFEGNAGKLEDDLTLWANKNGINLNTEAVNNYVRAISAKDTDYATVQSDLRKQYMTGAYPGWSDQIGAGQDIYDIASPYRQLMSRKLGIPEAQISFDDPLLAAGMQATGPDGKARIMPMHEFEQEIRKTDRYDKTPEAMNEMMNVGTELLKMFGFR